MIPEAYATYRLQMRNGMDFGRAIEIVPYLQELGITHLYLSPIFKAPESSPHGYDIADPTVICQSLGGLEAFKDLSRTLKSYNMGLILDIVPNHMSADPKYNQWWWDVLEKGIWSHYEDFFDIYWTEFSETPYRDKIVLPILGEPLENTLHNAQISFQIEGSTLALKYFEHSMPINLQGISILLNELTDIADLSDLKRSLDRFKPKSFNRFFVSKESVHAYHRQIKQLLTQQFNKKPDQAKTWTKFWNDPKRYNVLIRKVLEQQFYKLVWWKNGRYLINYRRFFTINDLIAVKEEQAEVFQKTHKLIKDLYELDMIDGLRVDHPDGLNQPSLYFENLRRTFPKAIILAEKILEKSESLPGWPIQGTTGYDFLADLTQLFMYPKNEEIFNRICERFIGSHESYEAIVHSQKSKLLEGDLCADFQRVVRLFFDLVYTNRSAMDHSYYDCEQFLKEIIVSLETYRTYLIIGQDNYIHQQSAQYWKDCLVKFDHSNTITASLCQYFRSIIENQLRSPAEQTFLDYLQKLTSPVMAKAAEDHAFYRYHRMVVLNEVGSSPTQFSMSETEFHTRQLSRNQNWPRSMLASSTHDCKRSEDIRARLCVISEIPRQWEEKIRQWHRMNIHDQNTSEIDRQTEYFLYQNLVGVWPISLDRFNDFMIKSAREAGAHSSWRNPDHRYEQSLTKFVASLFSNEQFVNSINAFVQSIESYGYLNSINQMLIKMTSPGIPDIYQGSETYYFALVDPDNRGKIDFAQLSEQFEQSENLSVDVIRSKISQPLVKIWFLKLIMEARHKYSNDFAPGASYEPLSIHQHDDEGVIGYLRGQSSCIIASRFPQLNAEKRREAVVDFDRSGQWFDLINQVSIGTGTFVIEKIWPHFPASFLVKTS